MGKAFALVMVAAALTLWSSAALASDDGKNRKVVVQNISSQTVRELYASPVTSTTWEEDLLEDRTLAPGASVSANIDNGTDECTYDLKVVLANGVERVRRGVDICAISNWAIGDTGDTLQ
jgi:hypothetical protein